MTPRLYGFFRSGTTHRVRIALNLKGVSYETVPINLRTGEHRSTEFRVRSPQGLVPILEIEGATLIQSVAILEYLEESYPAPPMLPADRVSRARVRGIAATIGSDTHPLNNLRVLDFLRERVRIAEPSVVEWANHWIAQSFAAIECMLASDSRRGAYCVGTSPTLADVYLIPQVYSARRFGVDLHAYPNIASVDASCAKLPAFFDARPDAQPDAVS